MQRTTGFAYTVPAAGGIQAQVTDPKANLTTYLMDPAGRPVQVTNAKQQKTTLAYDSDNNVTTLTEDNGAKTTWTYDPDTGYPTAMTDAQANHDGTAGSVYTYQTRCARGCRRRQMRVMMADRTSASSGLMTIL